MSNRIPSAERSAALGSDVFVYKNLRHNCWSIRVRHLVTQHANVVWLTDVTFKVSEAGRRRVLREGRKNVHAGLKGTLLEYTDTPVPNHPVHSPQEKWHTIKYNPYDGPTFIESKDNLPPYHKKCVLMVTGCATIENGIWYTEEKEFGSLPSIQGLLAL